MSEADLKGKLVKLLREKYPGYVIWRIEDGTTSGIPDLIVNGNKITSYWEIKFANPAFRVKGIQERTAIQLARVGLAKFIVYWEKDDDRKTYIVDPRDINKPITSWENFVPGFNHTWLVSQIGAVHGDYTIR